MQGDREREMGVEVTPFCDRTTVVVATSQLKFINMFLRPLLSTMEVRPRRSRRRPCEPLLTNNRRCTSRRLTMPPCPILQVSRGVYSQCRACPNQPFRGTWETKRRNELEIR